MAKNSGAINAVVGLDGSRFNTGVQGILQKLGLMKENLSSASSSMQKFGQSTADQALKAKLLSDQITLQNTKMAKLSEAFAASVKAKGADSEATLKIGVAMDKAEIAMAKLQISVDNTDKSVAKQGDTWKTSASKASDSTKSLGDHFATVKNIAVGLGATLLGGMGLTAIFQDSVTAAQGITQLALRMGITTDQAEKVENILTVTNTSTQPLISTMSRLDKGVMTVSASMQKAGPTALAMKSANEGVTLAQDKLTIAEKTYKDNSPQVAAAQKALTDAGVKLQSTMSKGSIVSNVTTKALAAFGVSLTDAKGKLLPMTGQIQALADGYARAAKNGQQTAYAAQVLGSKGTQLIPMLANYATAKAKAAAIPSIGTPTEIAELVNMGKEQTVLTATVKNLGINMTTALLPIAAVVFPKLLAAVVSLSNYLETHKKTVEDYTTAIANVGSMIVTKASPAVTGLMNFIVGHGKGVSDVVVTIFGAFMAYKVIVVPLMAVQKAIGDMQIAIDAFKLSTTYAWIQTGLFNAGLIAQKAAFIIGTGVEKTATAAQWLFNAALDANPIGIVIIAVAALIAVGVLLWKNWDTVKAKCIELWAGIQKAFAPIGDLINKAKTWGSDMISGIGAGINAAKTDLLNGVSNIGKAVITTFDKLFGIASPSKVMFTKGGHIVQGLINGLKAKNLSGFITGMVNKAKEKFGKIGNSIKSFFTGGGNVSSWVNAGLAAAGEPLSWAPAMMELISAESSGNPTAVNPEAVDGEHATGIGQMLPSTFSAHMVSSLNNILNPIDNIASSARYIQSEYGSPGGIPGLGTSSYHGYALGTNNAAAGGAWVGEHEPEWLNFRGGETVTPLHQINAAMQKLSSVGGSTSNNKNNNVHIDKVVVQNAGDQARSLQMLDFLSAF